MLPSPLIPFQHTIGTCIEAILSSYQDLLRLGTTLSMEWLVIPILLAVFVSFMTVLVTSFLNRNSGFQEFDATAEVSAGSTRRPAGEIRSCAKAERLGLETIQQLQQRISDLQSENASLIATQKTLRESAAYLEVYRMIVDHHAIVAETDVRGTITRVNDLFCEISGYSREELIGQNHRILNSGTHPKSMWQEMYNTVARGGVWHGDICNRAKNGTLYWVDTTIAPMVDERGKVRGYFAIRADISELKQAQDQAEAASRAKSEFLANMSHEIRTPMTAIMGFAELLGESVDRGTQNQQLEFVRTIKRNGEHLLSIINNILDLSKIEADKMTVEHIDTSPEQIILDVLSLMRVKAEAKGLWLRAEFVSPVPRTIQSDPTRIRQILVNLVGNAIKFTECGGVLLRASFLEGKQTRLKIDVIDTGIGMAEDQLTRLFNYFEQADASTTRRFGGSGLGLRISKRLAEMLGGDITVRSSLKQGSTFTVTFDTGSLEGMDFVVPRDSTETQPVSAQEPQPLQGVLAGHRVLLAEDGPDNQRLISFHLRKAGAIVQIAENGRIALELLTTDGTVDGPLKSPLPVDLIVTDIQMPEMDGLRLSQLLRSKGCTIPILALTAHAMSGDTEKCLAAGCDAHLTKPIEKSKFISLCAEWTKKGNPKPLVSMPISPIPAAFA